MDVKRLLFPDPPRRIPGHRWIGVVLRTAHIAAFGILLGGHVFDVAPSRLVPFLVAAIATGAGLVALELASTCLWLVMGKGVAVLVKLVLIALVPLFWSARVPLLLAVVVIASVAAHMPSRLRHRLLVPGLGVPGSVPSVRGDTLRTRRPGVVERGHADLLQARGRRETIGEP